MAPAVGEMICHIIYIFTLVYIASNSSKPSWCHPQLSDGKLSVTKFASIETLYVTVILVNSYNDIFDSHDIFI